LSSRRDAGAVKLACSDEKHGPCQTGKSIVGSRVAIAVSEAASCY
jgi:hypothetical protein